MTSVTIIDQPFPAVAHFDTEVAALVLQSYTTSAEFQDVGIPGPPGPPGPAGTGSAKYSFNGAGATWTSSHPLGREPMVQVFLTGGDAVIADIHASSTDFSVVFASPQTGYVLLL